MPYPQREITDSDRLINVTGYSEAFLDAICLLIDDVNNPGWIFFIGDMDRQITLLENIKRARPDLDSKNWHASKPSVEKNGATIQFSLASEECAYHLVDIVNCKGKPQTEEGEPFRGKVKAVVLFSQQGNEQYLGHVLNCCSRLKAFRVLDYKPNGEMTICTKPPAGFEPVPVSVDFTKTQPTESVIESIPTGAMFGYCKQVAEQTHCPLGYAYIAAVAVASTSVTPNCNIRPAIYAGLNGNVHSGKSLSCTRVLQLLGLEDAQGNPLGDTLISMTPASDRGLYKMFPEEQAVIRLLYVDEGRDMMSKANIQGSSLISVLCALFNRTRAGVADKFGAAKMNVRLSMLLNFKVRDASEFPEIFTHATSHGLYDRFLFGVKGAEAWRYTPWEFDEMRDTFVLQPSTPHVSAEIFAAVHKWSAKGIERDRLAEIALRVAYVTSAVNGDDRVSVAALDAALCLMEWQEKIRAEFQPAKGSSLAEDCSRSILEAFTKDNGFHYNFRKMARKHHWYEKFASVLLMIRGNLEKDRVIKLDKKTGDHYLNEEQCDAASDGE